MTHTRTLVSNAVLVLTSDVVNRAATFVLYAMVARYLGPTGVGQLALALALFCTFQVFAAGGVRTMITREVARDPTALRRCLASGTLLVTLASAASILVLLVLTHALGYSRETASVVLLLAFALLPYARSVVCEAAFQAFDRMRYLVYAHVPVHVARVALAYVLLRRGHGAAHVAALLLASHCAVAAVESWLARRLLTQPSVDRAARLTTTLTRTAAGALVMARSARTFLGIDGLVGIGASLNIVLLSALVGERQVGLYSAAIQLLIPITLVHQSVVISVFPTLCRMVADGPSQVTTTLSRMLALLLALAIPTTVGLWFLGESALLLLYGERDFLQASTALRVIVWTLVPVALTTVLGQVLLAGGRERVTLRIAAANLLVGLVAGVVLIAKFGLIGAAGAAVLTRLVSVWQHYRPVSSLLSGLSLVDVSWRPVVAGGCMAAYLGAAHGQGAVLAAACASALYVGTMLMLTIWTAGGPGGLWAAMSDAWPIRRQI
jgi:O-antigen/teichoic acid export membrane protein